jgi:hypothetical protein
VHQIEQHQRLVVGQNNLDSIHRQATYSRMSRVDDTISLRPSRKRTLRNQIVLRRRLEST